MNKLTQALMEELTVEYVKVGSLQIPESVVISWVIMLLLADAQKQADEIVAAGKAAVEIERQNKLREADAQATALARSMCEKLLKHNLTAQDDDQLLDDLLQKAGAGNGN